jgi:hypothetical protein
MLYKSHTVRGSYKPFVHGTISMRKVSRFSQSLPISHILTVLRRKSADKAFLRRGNKRLRRGIESYELFYLIMEDRICGIGEIYYCHCVFRPAIQFINLTFVLQEFK